MLKAQRKKLWWWQKFIHRVNRGGHPQFFLSLGALIFRAVSAPPREVPSG
jgi:hypothetical protein